MKMIDELLENLEDAGYDMGLQKRDLAKYRRAIEAKDPILAQRKCDELCAAVRMLLSLNEVNGVEAWEIMENLKEEGQADGSSKRKTGHGQYEPGSFSGKEVSEHWHGI